MKFAIENGSSCSLDEKYDYEGKILYFEFWKFQIELWLTKRVRKYKV